MLHQRVLDAPRGATGVHAASQAHITASYIALLRTLAEQIKALEKQIDQQLDSQADAHIFTPCPARAGPAPLGSWPRSGTAARSSPRPSR